MHKALQKNSSQNILPLCLAKSRKPCPKKSPGPLLLAQNWCQQDSALPSRSDNKKKMTPENVPLQAFCNHVKI